MDFTEEQLRRYSRHILLPEVGGEGQRRLLGASVAIVGAGGLGSPAGFYLAAAGVGTLGVIDGDRVELSNLQRQIAHDTARLGRLKAESARESFAALNPDVRVVAHAERLAAANVLGLLRAYDVVLDCSDNFPTRYLVNDACVLLRKPLVSAAVFRFEGQVFSVFPREGPCYRCLFASPPPAGAVPTCAEAGVLGVVPGVLGTLQATEALKIVLGVGEPLRGRLLHWNALTAEFTTLQVRRDPRCPVCGDEPTIAAPVDIEAPC